MLMQAQGTSERGTMQVPRALVDVILQLDLLHEEFSEYLHRSRPHRNHAAIQMTELTPAELRMWKDLRSKYLPEEVAVYDDWLMQGKPELIPMQTLGDVMSDMGIRMPDEEDREEIHLPALVEEPIGDEIPEDHPPVRFSSEAQVKLAMMLSDRVHGTTWDSLDEDRKAQIWHDAGEMLEIAGQNLL